MTEVTEADVSRKSIAEDLLEYLRTNSSVCATGNVHGWRWVRYQEGEWRAAKYGGQHRLKRFVDGTVLDEGEVLNWLVSKPIELIPASEAFLWGPKEETVWEDAADQDVFTEADRCYWCGQSERSVGLSIYETAEQGDCHFCPDCHESWKRAGEIESGPIRCPCDVYG